MSQLRQLRWSPYYDSSDIVADESRVQMAQRLRCLFCCLQVPCLIAQFAIEMNCTSSTGHFEKRLNTSYLMHNCKPCPAT